MSKIEWTDKTWNPVIGCSKISEGCKNCYAEKMAYRLRNIALNSDKYNSLSYYPEVIDNSGKWKGKTILVETSINKPFKWKKPRKIFVCSMGDLFHESVPFEWIDKIMSIISSNPHHIFQILTKRPDRMLEYFDYLKTDFIQEILFYSEEFPPQNLWVGATIENQDMANKIIPFLLKIPAKVRFVSCEPLLSNIDLEEIIFSVEGGDAYIDSLYCDVSSEDDEMFNGNTINWIIAGPETGPKARPMQKKWIESLYQQCKLANVPFFDKKNILELDLKQFPK